MVYSDNGFPIQILMLPILRHRCRPRAFKNVSADVLGSGGNMTEILFLSVG